MIKKDVAYDFMSKKEKASDKQTKSKKFIKTTVTTDEDPLSSRINQPISAQKKSKEYVDNLRKTENNIVFDVVTTDGSLIKDLTIPNEQIYSQKSQLAQERMMETERKQRKMIEFFIIYPAAILSSIIIIHGFVSILPMLREILGQ